MQYVIRRPCRVGRVFVKVRKDVTRIVRNGFLNFGSVSGSVLKKTAGSVRFRFCEKPRFGSVSAIIYLAI